MSIQIQITDSLKTIERNVNQAIADYINDTLTKKQSRILKQLQSLIPSWIEQQPEVQSILSGSPDSLAGQFGITLSPVSIISSITDSVVNSAEIKFIRYNRDLKGGFELSCQPSNLANLLAQVQGHTLYNGGDLHWLDWLLLRGDSIIVTNYQYNPRTGLGRSGLGNMVPGGAFRVPPQFSGTKDNNFITRALLGKAQEDMITKIISSELGQ